uniref:Ubiquitin-like domain-containing protein n=1 Tax=Panagrolaimus sp. JU765 TaxID=591449 RepID=A0AC34QB91_9BILA
MSIQIHVMLAGEPLQINIAEDFEAETNQDDFCAADFICKTVGDLRSVVHENSKYDGHTMKLIYKGKMLGMDPVESLQKYGFKTNDRLMGLGKPKTELIEDVGLRELR